MYKKIIAAIFLLLVTVNVSIAQDKYWQLHNAANDTMRLNWNLFSDQMGEMNIISQRNNKMKVISFPVGEGRIMQFEIEHAAVMEPALLEKYPNLQSFAGKATEDQRISIRFDTDGNSLHGMVILANGTVRMIDPAGNSLYTVKEQTTGRNFNCYTGNIPATINNTVQGTGRNVNDGKLRTYRIAICTSGEFSQYYLNGSELTDEERKAKVMAAVHTLITRVNALYERDLGVRLLLVANNDEIIYLNAATDPWTSNNSNSLRTNTQQVCDSKIGDANYDLGHLLHRASNDGDAGYIGGVCATGQKGSAYTAYWNLADEELMVIDYLAHEIGHQLGARHTFSFLNESSGVQVEPGSGSTIMSYAGIVNGANVELHNGSYFHGISIEEITTITQNRSFCGNTLGNAAVIPVIFATGAKTIPAATPFKLTGGAQEATMLYTYNWEQVDSKTGSFSIVGSWPSATQTNGAQFRSYAPVHTPSRVFPVWESILSGSNGNDWEVLPAVAREMNFRLTVRNNETGGGANESIDTKITVAANTGPFSVNIPNTTLTWEGGSVQVVRWNVANTNQAPVNCNEVNILLSTNGGSSFDYLLANKVPNNGIAEIVLPHTQTTEARIMIEASDNIFFDVSDKAFTIQNAAAGFDITRPAPSISGCVSNTSATYMVTVPAWGGFNAPVTLSAENIPQGAGVTFSKTTVLPEDTVWVTLSNTTAAQGSFTVLGTSGSLIRTAILFYEQVVPVFTTNLSPVSSLCEGADLQLFVEGNNINGYQWQESVNGTQFVNIPFQNSRELRVESDLINNYYRVIISNEACTMPVISGVTKVEQSRPPEVAITATRSSLVPGQTALLEGTVANIAGTATYSWYRNNEPMGLTTPSITVSADSVGDFQLEVTVSNAGGTCKGLSPIVQIGAAYSDRLFLYPNPNNGHFTVAYYNRSNRETTQYIRITDLSGRSVYQQQVVATGLYTLHNVQLNNMAKGMYILVLYDRNENVLKQAKFMVE